jgi:hypothetical protein
VDARALMAVVRRQQGELAAAMAEAQLAERLARELDYVQGYLRAGEILRTLQS